MAEKRRGPQRPSLSYQCSTNSSSCWQCAEAAAAAHNAMLAQAETRMNNLSGPINNAYNTLNSIANFEKVAEVNQVASLELLHAYCILDQVAGGNPAIAPIIGAAMNHLKTDFVKLAASHAGLGLAFDLVQKYFLPKDKVATLHSQYLQSFETDRQPALMNSNEFTRSAEIAADIRIALREKAEKLKPKPSGNKRPNNSNGSNNDRNDKNVYDKGNKNAAYRDGRRP